MANSEEILKLIERAVREGRKELTKLTRLTSLDLGGNQFRRWPREITKLTCLIES